MPKELEYINTRQVSARIRTGKLPEYCDGGKVHCSCHPSARSVGDTESLRIWSKGDRIGCPVTQEMTPALAVFTSLGIVIDTRR